MAKSVSQRAMVEVEPDDEAVETKGRKPDFNVRVRQPPYVGKDGKKYQSKHFTTVEAAWKMSKTNEKTGEVVDFVAIKMHVKVVPDDMGFLLWPPFENENT